MIWDLNLFWIILFIFQIILLNFLSKNFHSYLFFLTGAHTGKSLFSAKIAGLILFIGTLIHELSHVLMAGILFVRVKSLNLKTELTEDKHIRFGTAEVEQVDPFRNSLIGIAPLIFGLILVYFIASSIDLNNFNLIEFFKILLISQISNSMFLSKSDTLYFKYVFIIFIFFILFLFLINFFYNFSQINFFFSNILDFFKNTNLVSLLKDINLIFIFVILLNTLTNLFLKFLSKYKRY